MAKAMQKATFRNPKGPPVVRCHADLSGACTDQTGGASKENDGIQQNRGRADQC